MSGSNILQLYEEQLRRRAAASAEPRPEGHPSPLWVEDDAWDEASIPRRPWVAEGYLLRGSVTVAAGLGSAGKSSLMLAWAVALALNVEFGRFRPRETTKTLLYNVEDDADEQRRRLSATLRQFGVSSTAIRGQVIRCGPTQVGTLLERDLVTGQLVMTEAWDALEALLAHYEPGAMFLDPLAEIHNLDENDNSALRQVMARLRDLAVRFHCAILVVHHARKGGEAGDVDMIRGAGAIVAAARVALTIAPMSPEEATELGIQKESRRGYFRVDRVKANYTSTAEADWHQLLGYMLDNDEEVAAALPWSPGLPQKGRGVDQEVLALVAGTAGRGTEAGPYSPRVSVDQPRSIALAMVQHGVTRPQDQKALLLELFKSGWTVTEFTDSHRNKRNGLRSPEGLPQCDWNIKPEKT